MSRSGKVRIHPLWSVLSLRSPLTRLLVSTGSSPSERATLLLALPPLLSSILNVSLAHSWLSTSLTIMKLHGYLLQATLPSLPKLLQLPHLTFAQAKAAEDKLRSLRGPGGIETWNRLSNEQRKVVLAGALNDEQLRETAEIARTWPKLEVLGAKFKGQSSPASTCCASVCRPI